MSERVLTEAPDKDQRIEVLYAWIGIHADGGEGILSTDLPTPWLPGGPRRHMPLVTSKREVAELCASVAREIQRASMHQADRFVRIELREFRRVGNG
jgi:hypothetical protein